MVETFGTTQAVDMPDDVDKVLELLWYWYHIEEI
jgi:hypothetical protein